MKRKVLIAIGLVLTIGLVGVAGIAAAEGEVEVAGRSVRHGTILEISGESLLLQTRNGELTVLTDENTHYRIPGVQEPGLNDLSAGDHIGIAGRRDEDGAVLARLIIRIPDREEVGQLRGELTAKGDDWLEITLPDGTPVTILVNDQTHFRIPDVEDPGLDDLNVSDPVFARGLWNDDGELEARLVGLVPDGVENILRGKVTTINDPTIEVLTRQGAAVVITDAETRFHIPGVENPSLADIAIDDIILAGGVKEEDGLHAVVVAVTPERPQRTIRRGTVSANDGSSLTLETPNGEVIVLTDENTRFRVAGVEDATIDDVQVGFQAVAGGLLNPSDGTLQARLVGARPAPAGAGPDPSN